MTEKVHVLKPTADETAETDLQQRARQIGALAGRVAALVQQARAKLNDRDTWRLHAEDRYQQVRRRARDVVHDYPVQVVVAAGLVGFIVGAVLRVRRTHRAR
jgi:ElaB/YqjD/DUF883 family membrane-anchored ribosome-binding protein